ncbi:MAG: sulfur carrier protein ThiS [Actinomycetota bacterium]|nr:sulfur carrier protein ThiS [Actinomycetota bacterium]
MNEVANVVVNGEERTLASGTTVAELIGELGVGPKGVAVAVNGEVVARGVWTERTLDDSDRVEVLGAMQGG